jgi:hypothetical protein
LVSGELLFDFYHKQNLYHSVHTCIEYRY